MFTAICQDVVNSRKVLERYDRLASENASLSLALEEEKLLTNKLAGLVIRHEDDAADAR